MNLKVCEMNFEIMGKTENWLLFKKEGMGVELTGVMQTIKVLIMLFYR